MLKRIIAVIMFFVGAVASLFGLFLVHPGLALATIGALIVRHALSLDD